MHTNLFKILCFSCQGKRRDIVYQRICLFLWLIFAQHGLFEIQLTVYSALSRLADLGIYDITRCGIWLLTIFHIPYIHFQRELRKVTSPKWYLSFFVQYIMSTCYCVMWTCYYIMWICYYVRWTCYYIMSTCYYVMWICYYIRISFKVTVTMSWIVVPIERSCHKECTSELEKVYLNRFKSYGQVLLRARRHWGMTIALRTFVLASK